MFMATRESYPQQKMLSDLLIIVSFGLPVSSWMLAIAPQTPSIIRRRSALSTFILHSSGILDVEFERLDQENATANAFPSEMHADNLDLFGQEPAKSLLDLSLESDPDFSESRIPFLDHNAANDGGGTNYIDVKIAFMAELDGVQYGIGVPFDSAVALTVEKPDGSVQYLAPDVEDNEELMQIMAAQLHDNVGTDLQLQKTPRVLTVAGPLDNYTKNWREKLLPNPVEPNDLMDSNDGDGLDFFPQIYETRARR